MEQNVILNNERKFVNIGKKSVEILEEVYDADEGIVKVFSIDNHLCFFNDSTIQVDDIPVRVCSFHKALDEFPLMVGIFDFSSDMWLVKAGSNEFRTTSPLETAIRQMR